MCASAITEGLFFFFPFESIFPLCLSLCFSLFSFFWGEGRGGSSRGLQLGGRDESTDGIIIEEQKKEAKVQKIY